MNKIHQGHHVLEAIADQAIVTAIIDVVSNLEGPGPLTRRVRGPADGTELELQLERTGPGGSIEMIVRRVR